MTRAYRELYSRHGQTSPPELAKPAMARIRGESIADVGCGAGVYGYLIRNSWHFTGSWTEEKIPAARELVGIDFSQVAIDVVESHRVYHRAVLADSDRLPLGNSEVDCAVSMENLEHLYPREAIVALNELARIAKRRIVITTPAPWKVVNRRWLAEEICAAEADEEPLGYGEFQMLAGMVHKSTLFPDQMRRAGFQFEGPPGGPPAVVIDSIIYWADVSDLRLDRLDEVTGIAGSAIPKDDGRADWREEYVRILKASRAMAVPEQPPKAPLEQQIRRALQGIRSRVRNRLG